MHTFTHFLLHEIIKQSNMLLQLLKHQRIDFINRRSSNKNLSGEYFLESDAEKAFVYFWNICTIVRKAIFVYTQKKMSVIRKLSDIYLRGFLIHINYSLTLCMYFFSTAEASVTDEKPNCPNSQFRSRKNSFEILNKI